MPGGISPNSIIHPAEGRGRVVRVCGAMSLQEATAGGISTTSAGSNKWRYGYADKQQSEAPPHTIKGVPFDGDGICTDKKQPQDDGTQAVGDTVELSPFGKILG